MCAHILVAYTPRAVRVEVHRSYRVAISLPNLPREGFLAALARAIGPARACPSGEHILPQGHRRQLTVGIVASLHCEPTPVMPQDRLVLPLDIHC